MNTSINKRLDDRTNVLSSIQKSIAPIIYSKEQNDFNNNMIINNQISQYKDDILGLVNNYYQDRYKDNIPHSDKFTNIVESYIESNYFGKYKPINGQFNSIPSELIISIEYNSTINNIISPVLTQYNSNILNLNNNTSTQPTQPTQPTQSRKCTPKYSTEIIISV